MIRFLTSLGLCALATSFARAESSPKSIDLWNGRDFTGWELVTQAGADIKAVCAIKPDGVLAIAGKPTGYLLADGSYANYQLHVEYRWAPDVPKTSNSGVLLHIASGPIDRKTWPLCFQVQTKISRAGDLLPMAGATFSESLSTAPGAKTPQLDRQKPDSEKPLGEWNVIDLVCRDGAIEVTVNGVLQNKITKCQPAAGKVGFQLEGVPYELRNLRLTPLTPAK